MDRKSTRIVVLNPAGAVLLVRYDDSSPANPSKPELLSYWVPPGGGVHDGESFESAAIRELEEETGIELPEVGPQIWSRERLLMHRGELKKHIERYFVAWAQPPHLLWNRTSETSSGACASDPKVTACAGWAPYSCSVFGENA